MSNCSECQFDLVFFHHPQGEEGLIGRVVKMIGRQHAQVRTNEDPVGQYTIVRIEDAIGKDLSGAEGLVPSVSMIQWIGVVEN